MKGDYTVYFAPRDAVDGQQMYLVRGNEAWEENLTCKYDEAADWYTFCGQYEPILTGEPGEALDGEIQAFLNTAAHRAELSAEMDLDAPVRFDIPAGPVAWEGFREAGPRENGSGTVPWCYTYQDQRLDVHACIEYPQLDFFGPESADPRADWVNKSIRERFFYGYYSDPADEWTPEVLMYGEVFRGYQITRSDRRYLSMRIFESNCFRRANHPNDWETGLTIDLETGEVLTLADVIGPDRTVQELLDSGAFHCLQIWRSGYGEDLTEIERRQIAEAEASVRADSAEDFYLTEDCLGLIDQGRYTVCMEAPLAALGLTDWAAA